MAVAHLHLHTDLSNKGMLDSVSSVEDYCEKANELGIKGFAITEHGNIANWFHKKQVIEANGMKYIHGVEAYISMGLKTKTYHCVLLALNETGKEELNVLTSDSFERNLDPTYADSKHFHRFPRIFIDDLLKAENIIILTACLGGFLRPMFQGDEDAMSVAEKVLPWGMETGKLYLEIQPQSNEKQMEYNLRLVDLHKDTGLPLVATNDVHYANDYDIVHRNIMQLSTDIDFDNGDESAYKLHMKSEEEMRTGFRENGIEEEYIDQAIDNTVKIYDMIEEFEMDFSPKYPNIYDNVEEEFLTRMDGLLSDSRISDSEFNRIMEEAKIYKKLGQMSYILMCADWLIWLRANDIHTGDGRGSCTGSQIAYRLGATGVNSMKWETNLFRFLNPDRVSMADIDIDIPSFQRNKAKSWFYDHPRMNACEVGAFGTWKELEAINSTIRGFNKAVEKEKDIDGIIDVSDDSKIAKLREKLVACGVDAKKRALTYEKTKSEMLEEEPKYKLFFSMVDSILNKILSFKNHPAGVVVWHGDLKKKIGFYTTSNEVLNGKPISNFNMNELDQLNYIKMDALGLATMEVVNSACDIANIERINSDNAQYDDQEVWDSIERDGTAIFQFASSTTHGALATALKSYKDADISNFFIMCHCSGIIRPSCASIRDDFLEGKDPRWCFEEIKDFFPKTLGYIIYQEDIMNFLTEFCGYSGSESDSVRRKIAKKKSKGYAEMIEEISRRFRDSMWKLAEKKFGAEDCYGFNGDQISDMIDEDLQYFIQVVEDAQNYAFSYNHSMPYSSLGYISGYLRHHHPVAFFTAYLNAYTGKEDKMKSAFAYINEFTDVEMSTAKWGGTIGTKFSADIENGIIYEGLADIKDANKDVADRINRMPKKEHYRFVDLLVDSEEIAKIGNKNLQILIKLDFFRDFGNQQKLLDLLEEFTKGKCRYTAKLSQKSKDARLPMLREIEDTMPNTQRRKIDRFMSELHHIGKSSIEFDNVPDETYLVQSVTRSFGNYWVELYDLNTKQQLSIRYSKKNFDNVQQIEVGQFIRIVSSGEQFKKVKEDGKWIETTTKYIQMYEFKEILFK